MTHLVYGVGINDADYQIYSRVEGKRKACPIYVKWVSMLSRCYNSDVHKVRPNYIDVKVCNEWLTFSNFKCWMEKQKWQGKHLDKDILIEGNKIYSPDNCVFIDAKINCFLNGLAKSRGILPIGVSFHKKLGKYQSSCRNPITEKIDHLGYHSTAEKAHEAWRKRKHELACQLADTQTDPRVAAALRTRYAPS